jgi:RNA polymerase sigma factor (sigma-70 family)
MKYSGYESRLKENFRRMSINLELDVKIEEQTGFLFKTEAYAKVIPIGSVLNSEEIFLALYNKYHENVRKYASILYKDQEGYTEDLVQDIFMKLWERRDKLHMIDCAENYLSIMTKNQFLMEKRTIQRRTNSLTKFQAQQASQDNLTEQDVFYRESKMMINHGMKKLPPRMKIAITLKQEGYKIKEIALLMNINNCTAKNHVIKALNKMKVFLN